METAKTNAIQRVTFLRWYRTGWNTEGRWFGDGFLQINFTDDDSGSTIKTGFVIPNGPEGKAIVHSIAALNGLEMHNWHGDENNKGMWYQEWNPGKETPRLHKWYEESPLVLGDEQVSVEKCPACGYCNCICEIVEEHEL